MSCLGVQVVLQDLPFIDKGIWGAFLASSDVLVPNIMVVKGSLFSCTVVVIVVIIKFGRVG